MERLHGVVEAWLNASQRSPDSVHIKRSVRESSVKCLKWWLDV